MVQNVDFQQLAGANEVARDFDVRFGGSWIATGMIVRQDDRGGVGRDGWLKDLARMHQNRVEGTLGDFLKTDQLPTRVQEQDLEVLDLQHTIFLTQQVSNALRCVQRGQFLPDFLCHSTSQRERGLERDGLVPAYAFDLAQFRDARAGQIVQG